MGGGNVPRAPDPYKTAGAQTGQNVATAIANQGLSMVDQKTPWGNLTYKATGESTRFTDPASGREYNIPRYSATQELSATQQRLMNTTDTAKQNFANAAANQSDLLQNTLGKPLTTDGLPSAGNASSIGQARFSQIGGAPALRSSVQNVGDVGRFQGSPAQMGGQFGGAGQVTIRAAQGPDQFRRAGPRPELSGRFGGNGNVTQSYGMNAMAGRNRAEQALFGRMEPRLERDRKALEARLATQGIRRGSEAYGNAMSDQSRAVNDARLGAISQAGQEQSRAAGLDQQRAMFANQAQAQSYNQAQGRQAFANQASQQNFANRMQQSQFNNQIGQQRFTNQVTAQNANNQAQAQSYNQAQGRQAFANQAAQQNFANRLEGLRAGNQAQAQAHSQAQFFPHHPSQAQFFPHHPSQAQFFPHQPSQDRYLLHQPSQARLGDQPSQAQLGDQPSQAQSLPHQPSQDRLGEIPMGVSPWMDELDGGGVQYAPQTPPQTQPPPLSPHVPITIGSDGLKRYRGISEKQLLDFYELKEEDVAFGMKKYNWTRDQVFQDLARED